MLTQSTDAAERTRRRFTSASTLGEVLAAVLDQIADATPFDRAVAVAGLGRDLLGVGRGVPATEVDAFVRALVRQRFSSHGDVGTEAEESPLAALTSMRSPVLVPAVAPNEDLVTVLVVEATPEHPAFSHVHEALRTASPFLFAAAELYALRARTAALESQRQRAYWALDALPDPVLVVDAESRILLSNRRAEELLVTHPGDSRGRRHAVETNNLFLSAFRARAMLVEQSEAAREIVLLDPDDGSDLLFEVFGLALDNPGSGAESHVFVLRDITDLKAAARELEVQFSRSVAAEHRARRESERLNVIIENAGVPIFVTDRHTNIQLMNREAERLLEARPGTAQTSPRVHDIRANDAKLAGLISEFLLHARSRREARLMLVDPDEAREFPALAVSTKILDDRGEPVAVVTVLHDLTHEVESRQLALTTGELTKRNTQLEEQHTALERASRLKSEFLATMSHELRTPINAVLGYNSLLRDGLFGKLTERQRDALDRMRNAAEHLLSLINDVLDLSRVEAGKITLSPVDIDWAPFLETLSESVRPLAAEKSLAYTVELEEGLPAVRTDEMRLRQVLLNLLTNAVKFTDRGWVKLRVASVPGGNRVQMDVVDTGIGIEETHLEAIFDEFTQVDQSSTREHGGAGLGLAISRRLIRVMGGSLTVKSAPGKGSTFRVELPSMPPMSRELVASPTARAGAES
jgi:signal transduction histidine kinase